MAVFNELVYNSYHAFALEVAKVLYVVFFELKVVKHIYYCLYSRSLSIELLKLVQ